MARKPRIEFAGAVYHAISRGDRGEDIYRDEEDRHLFLRFLGAVCERTGWQIHAFILMSNHYHILLETPEANLMAGMKWLQGIYTQRFNLRHNLRGHLFQGRYKALLIDGAEAGYFLQASNYIHLNPIRAGLVKAGRPFCSYRWSSFPGYLLSSTRRMEWLYVDRVFGELGLRKDNRRSRQNYEKYMEDLARKYRDAENVRDFEEKWKGLRRGWYWGDEDFRQRLLDFMEKALEGKSRESYLGDELREHDEVQADKILRRGFEVLGIVESDLQNTAKGAPQKQILAWWLRKKTLVSRKWIGEKLRMGDLSRVTNAVRKVDLAGEGEIRRLKGLLERNS